MPHPFIDGDLGCFCLLANVNNATMIIGGTRIFSALVLMAIAIFLFLVVLGLAWVLSSYGKQGLPLIVVQGLLTVVKSLVADHRL